MTQPKQRNENPINKYFILAEGIHREVLQREICKFLGPEAYAKPAIYEGEHGYIINAVRPFTPEMLEDLKDLSCEPVVNGTIDASSGG